MALPDELAFLDATAQAELVRRKQVRKKVAPCRVIHDILSQSDFALV